MAVNSHVAMEDSNLTLNQLKKESFPFVFQCKGCNDIIGDSSNFISSDQELEVISLNAVTSLVSPLECLETSTEGADMGSTFRPLQCKSCNSVIGRVYRTTPKEFDHLRSMYCLDIEHIRSYQIGSVSGTRNGPVSSDEILEIPTAKALATRIAKIESVILMLVERMGLAEDTMNKQNDSSISTNKTLENKMDCQDTALQENDRNEGNKPSKKKRK